MRRSTIGMMFLAALTFAVASMLMLSTSVAAVEGTVDPLLLHGTPNPEATPQVSSESSTVSDPTYYRDIEPIFLQNCAACHTEGEIGHSYMAIEDVESIVDFENAEYIAYLTSIGYMPPWQPSDESLPMTHEWKLTDEEIAMITQWVENGAPLGDEADRNLNIEQDTVPEIRHDLVLTMPEPYTPTGEILDDYRCFLLDPGFEEDTYITGTHFIADNTEIAHHAIYFIINEETVPEAQARSGENGRPGWTCYGGTDLRGARGGGNLANADTRELITALQSQNITLLQLQSAVSEFQTEHPNVELDLLAFQQILSGLGADLQQLIADLDIDVAAASGSGMDDSIGGWVPGAVPVVSPENTGILVPAGSQIVVQMHYNLYNTLGTDQSSMILEIEPYSEDITPIRARSLVAPVEIPCPEGMGGQQCNRAFADAGTSNALMAACGQSRNTYADNTADNAYGYCDYPINFDGWILGVGPHMHELGKSARVVLNPDTPDETLLIDIPEWDFHWQGQYSFAQPVELQPGDVVRLECWWDNSEGDRYVVWGEGTQDEMCFNFTRFLVREPGKTLADYGYAENPEMSMDHTHDHDDATMHADGHDHDHSTLIEVTDDMAIPSVAMTVTQTESGGYFVQLAVENFDFAPEAVDGTHVPGEGHAHLYVNGEKVTRLYGTEYYMESLPSGMVEISVTLNTNDHNTYAHHGEIIGDSVMVSVE